MKTEEKTFLPREQYLRIAPVLRFLRTAIPQIPAVVIYLIDMAEIFNYPVWVVPTLMFLGAVTSALDKLIRELKKGE